MALIKCDECNREISDRAAECPQCGFPMPSKHAAVRNSGGTGGREVVATPHPVKHYTAQIDGEIKGPFTADEIVSLVRSGVMDGQTLVIDEQGRQQLASQIIASETEGVSSSVPPLRAPPSARPQSSAPSKAEQLRLWLHSESKMPRRDGHWWYGQYALRVQIPLTETQYLLTSVDSHLKTSMRGPWKCEGSEEFTRLYRRGKWKRNLFGTMIPAYSYSQKASHNLIYAAYANRAVCNSSYYVEAASELFAQVLQTPELLVLSVTIECHIPQTWSNLYEVYWQFVTHKQPHYSRGRENLRGGAKIEFAAEVEAMGKVIAKNLNLPEAPRAEWALPW